MSITTFQSVNLSLGVSIVISAPETSTINCLLGAFDSLQSTI